MSDVYQIHDGELTSVTECPANFVIPASVSSIPNSTERSLFHNCLDVVESIKAQDGCKITSIGQYAFSYCTKLVSVDLSNCHELQKIGIYTFAYCTKLSLIKLNNELISLGNSAFRSTSFSGTFTLNPVLEKFTGEAFFSSNASFAVHENNPSFVIYENNVYTKSLITLIAVSFSTEDLKLPLQTTTIGFCCFASSSIKTVNIPSSITTLSRYAFHDSRYLEQLTINSPITSIEVMTFHSLPHLKSLWLPDTLTQIKAPFLEYVPELQAIRFSDSLESVEPNSFVNVPNIRYIYNLDYKKRELLWSSGIPRIALDRGFFTCKYLSFSYQTLIKTLLFFFF